VIDKENLQREKERGGQRHEIARIEGDTPAHAEKIQADNSQRHAGPDKRGDALAEENADERYQKDIERRDETGFTDGCIKKPELLKTAGNEDKKTAHQAGGQYLFPGFPIGGTVLCQPLSVAQENNRQNHEPGQEKTGGLHGEGADILHAFALCHERRAPDNGGQQQKKASFQLFAHMDSSTVLKDF